MCNTLSAIFEIHKATIQTMNGMYASLIYIVNIFQSFLSNWNKTSEPVSLKLVMSP